MASPAADPSPAPSQHCSLQLLEDSLTKEFQPMVHTPESCQMTGQSCWAQTVEEDTFHLAGLEEFSAQGTHDSSVQKARVLDTAYDVLPDCDKGVGNLPVVLCKGLAESTAMSPDSPVEESQLCRDSIMQRLDLSSLRIKNSASALEKP
ncbi:hypothetical protein WISP_01573 [Willisornis vidua]|uniref:CE295 protein n=1 Tax=Willisornis vidua TaxID=1566151 RepID=A0ABQ9E021_9PASS|nr:hypothetical protein WISP_01573 [Willisornis vidua]